MRNVDASLKKCFGVATCPEPVLIFTKYVSKLNFDEKPDYEKCRKDFNVGLRTLGKSNTGDLEFRASGPSAKLSKTTSPSAKENVKPKVGARSTPVRPELSKITERTENEPNESPKKRAVAAGRSRKRPQTSESDDESEEEVLPKKSRGKATTVKTTATSSRNATPTTSTGRGTTQINNELGGNKSGKTYNLNFELDISFDANVVVNVKRKPRKAGATDSPKAGPSKPKVSIQSTDEIPPTEQSYAIACARVIKKEPRTSKASPRAKK